VQAILAIQLPTNVKQLRHFLGMVQYYHDLWARRSEMLAPLTSLVRECSQTKVMRAKGTKKVPWHWDEVHQRAFDHIKATIAREVVLACPDYSKVFKIYTSASNKQLGAVLGGVLILTLVLVGRLSTGARGSKKLVLLAFLFFIRHLQNYEKTIILE
jgi:hypothetical protein